MTPEKEWRQAGQTNVYVSNPQLSIAGSIDLKKWTLAVQLGHSATVASLNTNFEIFSTADQVSNPVKGSTCSAR